MIDLPTTLYVISKISFCCPQDIPAKALRILFLPIISSMSILGWVLAWCVSVAVRECIVVLGSVSAPRPILGVDAPSVLCCFLGVE